MACVPPPFAKAVLAEASRLSPSRRTSSDGVCADAAHYASGGDHVPDARGVPHAVDISHSVPGAPFWEARYGQFDVMAQARAIGGRMIAGTESRVKYLVANFGGYDQILNPSVAPYWRQNGNPKTEHRSHLHVSFTVAAEQSTSPFFTGLPEDDMPLNAADLQAVRLVVREEITKYVENKLGGYPNGVQYEDNVLWEKFAPELRQKYGLSKR